ncbi:MAG: hypothetical protein Q7T73_22460 [Beijerinckiaceae bacterium]|nr:hypothetical protein [Beijerinckiaceae bacterium]
MIVPLPIYVTDPADASASLLRLLGDLKLTAERSNDRFFRAADETTDGIYASDDIAEINDLADQLVGLLPHHTALAADRATAERRAREPSGDVLELANTLIDLRYRYDRLDLEINALRDRVAAAVESAPPSPTLPLGPGPLRVL